MKTSFTLKPSNRGITDEEIIDDIRYVASVLNLDKLTYKQYKEGGGKLDNSVIFRRVGPWNQALRKAGLKPAREVFISNEKLFENIEQLWRLLGRQPKRREVDSALSEYSSRPYVKRYGGWRAALEAFIEYIDNNEQVESFTEPKSRKKRTPRNPSLRLRFHVMKRDGFRCVHCGNSPAVNAGVELHIDHIAPWSCSGETLLENLQTLCSKCNFGKGNETEKDV